MDLSQMPWKDILTVGAASLGAGLGIMNTWNTISQRKLRLRITPAFVMDTNHNPLGFSIEVINLSSFPVTVAELGFRLNRRQKVPVQNPRFLNGGPLPRRLEARDAFSAYFDTAEFILPKGLRLGPAYVRTSCGRVIHGDSPARKQLSGMLADFARSRP